MHEHSDFLTYLLIGLAGGIGGGGAVAIQYIRYRRMPLALVLAYVVAGVAVGLLICAWLLVLDDMGVLVITEDHLIAVGLTSGMTAAFGLLVLQSIAAIALRWRGVEVAVTFTKNDRHGRAGGA